MGFSARVLGAGGRNATLEISCALSILHLNFGQSSTGLST